MTLLCLNFWFTWKLKTMVCFDFEATPRNIWENHATPEIPEILFEIEYVHWNNQFHFTCCLKALVHPLLFESYYQKSDTSPWITICFISQLGWRKHQKSDTCWGQCFWKGHINERRGFSAFLPCSFVRSTRYFCRSSCYASLPRER